MTLGPFGHSDQHMQLTRQTNPYAPYPAHTRGFSSLAPVTYADTHVDEDAAGSWFRAIATMCVIFIVVGLCSAAVSYMMTTTDIGMGQHVYHNMFSHEYVDTGADADEEQTILV